MAGYMTKSNHIYNGEFVANEKLENGLFVEIAAGKVKKTAAKKDTVLRIAEKTTLWGKPAVRLDVVDVGKNEIFLTENEWDIDPDGIYNTAEYAVEAGQFVKMHRPLPGEQMIITIAEEPYGTLEVGGFVSPDAAGTISANA